jgi:TRAP-type transport system periplasmic protein
MKEKRTLRILSPIGILSLVLLLALLAGAASCGGSNTASSSTNTSAPASSTAVKPVKLIFSFFEPPSSTAYVTLIKPWLEDVVAKSNGRIQIETHTGGEIVDLIGTYDAVVKGTIDLGYYFSSMNPVLGMADISTFFAYDKFHNRYSRVAWDLYKAFPEYQAQYKDVKCLWIVTLHSIGVGSTKKPIRTLADVNGMKCTTTGKWNAAREQAVGFVPVSLPPDAIVTSLQTGVLDCLGSGSWQFKDLNWGPEIKYFSTIGISEMEACMVINKDKWAALPADIQQIFTDTAEAAIDKWDSDMFKISKDRLASAPKDYKMEIISIPMSDRVNWAAKDKPVLASYAADLNSKGLPGDNYIAKFQELQNKYALTDDPYKQ